MYTNSGLYAQERWQLMYVNGFSLLQGEAVNVRLQALFGKPCGGSSLPVAVDVKPGGS